MEVVTIGRREVCVIRDIRFGLKQLWKHRGYAVTALLTLAVCIGANAAIFTIVYSIR
jgi:hypothetical protein